MKITMRFDRWIVAALLTTVTHAYAQLPNEYERIAVAIKEFNHHATAGRPGESQAERDARMAWWREARFGMFIHWGVYSIFGGEYQGRKIDGLGEWIMRKARIPETEYRQVARGFNPVKYDPDEWCRIAKDAGMKYIVITAKHHDGFALFHSKVSDWNVVDATVYGQDLLTPLAEACRKHGLKLGFYYSHAQDWVNPGGAVGTARALNPSMQKIELQASFDRYLRETAVPQVRELLTNYGDVAVLWWDTPTRMLPERGALFDFVTGLQPNIIENVRRELAPSGDFGTAEGNIPKELGDVDWETCMTMNGTWGYSKSGGRGWKTPKDMLQGVITTVSRGGNYLLNVGPTPEGEFPPEAVEIIRHIGEWMKVNGEAIYGTTKSPFSEPKWGRFTRKGDTVYASIFTWPRSDTLEFEVERDLKFSRAYFLADPGRKPIEMTMRDNTLVLKGLPSEAPDASVTVIVLE